MSADIEAGKCLCGCGETTTVYRGKHKRYVAHHHMTGRPSPRKLAPVVIPCERCSKPKE